MTKEDELKLKFYKNGAAEAVLKRFMFTEKEKKLIQDAIRTSNMPKPRMKLIDEVDVLLKDVAKFREPKSVEAIDKQELAIAVARVTSPIPPRGWFSIWYIVFFIFIVIIVLKIDKDWHDYSYGYSYEEAQSYCEKQGKVLPNNIEEIEATGYDINSMTNVWLRGGNIGSVFENKFPRSAEDAKYPVICVDSNSKDDTGF